MTSCSCFHRAQFMKVLSNMFRPEFYFSCHSYLGNLPESVCTGLESITCETLFNFNPKTFKFAAPFLTQMQFFTPRHEIFGDSWSIQYIRGIGQYHLSCREWSDKTHQFQEQSYDQQKDIKWAIWPRIGGLEPATFKSKPMMLTVWLLPVKSFVRNGIRTQVNKVECYMNAAFQPTRPSWE